MSRAHFGLEEAAKAAFIDAEPIRGKMIRFPTFHPSHSISDSASKKSVPLVHEFESCPDSFQAFKQFSGLPHCLFFESSARTVSSSGKDLGRYSFLMADPIQWIECKTLHDADASLKQLDLLSGKYQTENLVSLPPMQGGLAGLFSYDLNRAFESIAAPRKDEFETPLIAVGLYDVVLAWDHEENRSWLVVQNWSNQAAGRQRKFLDLIRGGDSQPVVSAEPESGVEVDNCYPVPGPEGLTSSFSKQQYLAAVEKAIEYIHSGDIFQVNLAQRLLLKAHCTAVELYQRLRQCNPAPFGGYFDFGSGQLISASPERFVSVQDGLIETRPIKGTRQRTGQPIVDIDASRKLEASEKDRAENTMIVDLMRNDLSRICADDSVNVTQLCEIERYQSVMHLVSAVEGKLTEAQCKPSELLRAIFPGGSITGAPKVRAMEIIAELEPHARGAYCGSLGYFGANGSVDLNILIRTITASKGWWQIPVGGGIVSQSNPQSEYDETWTKAAGMLNAVNMASRNGAAT